MKTLKFRHMLLTLLISSLFLACGGGGDSSSDTTNSNENQSITETTQTTNNAPIANAGTDTSIQVNNSVSLTGSGTDSDGEIVEYRWEEGNILLSSTASLNYTPDTVGTTILTFTVIDNDGNSASDTIKITVTSEAGSNQAPTVNAGSDKSVTVNESITLTGTATDSDGSIVSYEWTKDGVTLANTASFEYTPTVAGSETLTLTVTDDEGSKSTDSLTVSVTGLPSNGNKPFIFTIGVSESMWSGVDSLSIVPPIDGYNYNYNVDWGDGHISQGLTGEASHLYEKGGTYTIKIDGELPTFDFKQARTIEQWGSIKWKNMSHAFSSCRTSKINATDIPDFSEVNDTSYMFAEANASCFPSNMSQWDMSSVKNMERMFRGEAISSEQPPELTQDISNWDVSSVTNMNSMFAYSNYNGDFSKWNVSNVISMDDMFYEANLSVTNYDKLLNAWSKLELQPNVVFGGHTSNIYDGVGLQYTGNGREARKLLQSKFKWKITDAGIDINNLGGFKPFIVKWKTSGGSEPKISIPLGVDAYNIDWGDGTIDTNVIYRRETRNEYKTHVYANEGTYSIKISGNYPKFYEADKQYGQAVDIQQWGDIEWKTMRNSFSNSPNIIISATDAPNLLATTDMSYMFYAGTDSTFNSPIGHWDVSTIKNMNYMFYQARHFNQDLSSWDVSNVINMGYMFFGAFNFNQDLSNWNTSSVQSMSEMFADTKFNHDISSWNISKLTNLDVVKYTGYFNHDITNWDTSHIRYFDLFKAKSFNQDISQWDFSNATYIVISDSNISTENYSKLLEGLAKDNIQDNGYIRATNIKYNKEAQSARLELINQHGWDIKDDGLSQ
jgi:surface protein